MNAVYHTLRSTSTIPLRSTVERSLHPLSQTITHSLPHHTLYLTHYMTLYHLPQTITHSLPHHPLYLTHYMTLYHLPYHTLRYTFTFLGAYLMVCKKYTPPQTTIYSFSPHHTLLHTLYHTTPYHLPYHTMSLMYIPRCLFDGLQEVHPPRRQPAIHLRCSRGS